MSPCVQSGLWHWWWLCHYFALGALAHLQSWCTSSLLRWHTSHIANASLALLPASLPDKNAQIQASFCSVLLCLWWAFIHLPGSSVLSVFLCKTDFQMSLFLPNHPRYAAKNKVRLNPFSSNLVSHNLAFSFIPANRELLKLGSHSD